ncbi:hypothetical protein JTB14_026665 [Gonioctena quinquepunctata]|nr:hypothetical protein JTB14_026665 [Gonioctena quinquepunctata]
MLNFTVFSTGIDIILGKKKPETQREENFFLRKYLRRARENPNLRSYIQGNKLYVDNKSYKASDLEARGEEPTRSAPPTPTIKKFTEEENTDTPKETIERKENPAVTPTKTKLPFLNNKDPKQQPRADGIKSRTRYGSRS